MPGTTRGDSKRKARASRFQRGARAEFNATMRRMLSAAERLDVSKIRPDQLAAASGPPDD
jgi:hypothetical protein